MADLPFADDLIDAHMSQSAAQSAKAPAAAPELPYADDLIDQHLATKAPTIGMVDEFGRVTPGNPVSGPDADAYYAGVGSRVANAFKVGAQAGWGDGITGLDPKIQKAIKDSGADNFMPFRAFDYGLLRPAAAGLDAFLTAGSTVAMSGLAGASQIASEVGGPQFGRGIGELGEALLADAGAGVHPHIGPVEAPISAPGAAIVNMLERNPMAELDSARRFGVIGEPDGVWKGVQEPTPTTYGYTGASIKADQLETINVDANPPATPAEPATPPDIHAVARQVAPEVFEKYDALTAQRDTLRQQIQDAQEAARSQAEAQAPHAADIADLQARIEGATPRLAKKYQARLDEMIPERDAFLDNSPEFQELTKDTPEIQAARQQLMEADYAMRDMAPDVSAAYRSADELMPKPEETEIAPEPEAASVGPENGFDNEPLSNVPPPKDGMVRLFHGGDTDVGLEKGSKTWVAPKFEYARDFRSGDNKPNSVWYVDVKKGSPDEIAARAWDEIDESQPGNNSVGTYQNTEISAEASKNLKPYNKRALDAEMAPSAQSVDANGAVDGATGKQNVRKTGRLTTTGEGEFRNPAQQDWTPGSSVNVGFVKNLTVLGKGDNGFVLVRKSAKGNPSFYLSEPHSGLIEIERDSAKAQADKHGFSLDQRANEPAPSPPVDIAKDTTAKLLAAGRSADEAQAGGALLASHYEARAERFEGKLGTAQEIYAREAPDVIAKEVGGKGGEASGQLRIRGGSLKNIMTLFKKADASTFLHETGHQWLEEMKSDAAHPDAPDSLKADFDSVKKWIGNKADGPITTAQHERFAKGFENYLMEGRAPTKGLAGVFSKFRDWLGSIYNSATGSGVKLTDDVRDVFDRLVSKAPDARDTTIAKDETSKTLTDYPSDTEALANKAGVEPSSPQVFDDIREKLGDEATTAERDRLADEAQAAHEDLNDILKEHDDNAAPEAAGDDGAGASGGAEPADAARGEDGRANGDEQGTGGDGANRSSFETAVPDSAGEPFGPTRRADLVDRAGNINLDNLNAPDDVLQSIRDSANENDNFMDARRGVVHDADLLNLADALGMDPAELSKRKVGQAFNAEQIVAARKLLIKSATAVRDAMQKAAEGTDADVLAYAEARARHRMIQEQVAGLTAEAGRALRALQFGGKFAGDIADADALAKDATGKTLYQLRNEAKLGRFLDTMAKVTKFINDMSKAKISRWWDGLMSYYINNLISNPITHAAYATGNTVGAVVKAIARTPLEATIDSLRGAKGERVYYGETGAQLYGMWRGMRDGIRPGVEAFKSGVPFMKGDLEKSGAAHVPAIPGAIGRVLETPSRAVSALHTVFYSMNYEADIARRAYRQAASEGLDGDAFDARVAKITQSPPETMMKAAHDEASHMVLMGRPKYGSMQYHVVKAVDAFPPLKLAFPFMQIGTNIIQEGIVAHSPLALLSADARADLMGRNGEIARTTQIAKIGVGTGIAVSVMGLASEGLVTGGEPTDPKEAAAWRLAGNQAYSIRIGQTWYPYKKLTGIFGPLIAASADLHTVGHLLAEGEQKKAMAALVNGMSKAVVDETWMSGASNLLTAASHWDTDGERYLANIAKGFIPFSSATNQLAAEVDPYAREAHGILQTVRNALPWESEGLFPRRDIFGAPLTRRTQMSSSTISTDPAALRLQALQDSGHAVFPAPVQHDISGVKLTDQQYDDYAHVAGTMFHQNLSALVSAPGFSALPEHFQAEAIKSSVSDSREKAKAWVQMTYPDIYRQAVARQQALLSK